MSTEKRFLQSLRSNLLWPGFALAFIAAAVISSAAYSESSTYYYWSNWVSHTQLVLETLEEERVDLFDALIALETYYQTNDSKQLDKLRIIILTLQQLSAKLRALTRDNSFQQARLDQVEPIVDRLPVLFENAAYEAVFPERRESIKTPTSIALTTALSQVREQLRQMSAEENRLLRERLVSAQIASRKSIATIAVGGSGLFVWLLLVSGYAAATARRLRQTAQNLADSQEQLVRAAERRKAEEQFRKLIESAQDAMVIVGKGGRIILANEQAERLYGYTRAELLGMKAEMLAPARLRAEYRADPRLRTAGSSMEFYGLRKDGGEFPVEVSVSPVEFEDGTVISLAVRDITVRKKLERELREVNERYRMLVQNVQDYAILMLDPDGRVVSWNEGAQRIKGYTTEEIIGRHFSCFYPPEDVADGKPARELVEARQRGKWEDEGWRIRKDGSRFWANVIITALRGPDGGIQGFSKITRDITERKLAEDKFRGLLESAPDAILISGRDGRIALVNAQTEALFGYSREELLGQPIELLVPERSRAHHTHYRDGYFASPATRSMGAGADLTALRKDGSEFAAEISLSPIPTPEGILVTAAVRDVTERKRLEEEHHRRVNEANRLKSEFLANMSHELRTPLNAIIGFASLIHSGKVGPLNEDQKDYMHDILASSRHLLHLINDVLDLAKIEAGKMEFRSEPFALTSTVSEVIDTLRALAAEKHIRISSDISPALTTVNIDPAKFKQILYNYLSNAIKFTPEKGTVTVRIRPEDEHRFCLEVEDTGIGIAPQDLHRLFVEFQQLDSTPSKKFGGTGLGLSLTKRVVEAQGGTVSVHSVLGKGSIFAAVLPRSMPGSEELPAALPSCGSGDRPILVIEDDRADRDWMVRTLTNAGYSVEATATGAGAVKLCSENAFAAITLDLLLPDASGWEVLREIRSTQFNRQVPAIVVTLSRDQGLSSAFIIQDYLVKPIEEQVLLQSLKQADVYPDTGTVLVLDNDPAALKLVSALLNQLGYRAVCTQTAEEALKLARSEPPAVIVLELLLHGMNGFQFLEELRRTTRGQLIPVIIWTVKDLNADERRRLRDSVQAIVPRDRTNDLLEQLKSYLSKPNATHVTGRKEVHDDPRQDIGR